MKKMLTYGTGLIALYLVVSNAAGTAQSAGAATRGLVSIIKGLQGRD